MNDSHDQERWEVGRVPLLVCPETLPVLTLRVPSISWKTPQCWTHHQGWSAQLRRTTKTSSPTRAEPLAPFVTAYPNEEQNRPSVNIFRMTFHECPLNQTSLLVPIPLDTLERTDMT